MDPEHGLHVLADQFLWANRRLIIDLASHYRIPSICAWSHYVDQGGLMAYTVDVEPFWRGTGGYVDQLLRGISLAGRQEASVARHLTLQNAILRCRSTPAFLHGQDPLMSQVKQRSR